MKRRFGSTGSSPILLDRLARGARVLSAGALFAACGSGDRGGQVVGATGQAQSMAPDGPASLPQGVDVDDPLPLGTYAGHFLATNGTVTRVEPSCEVLVVGGTLAGVAAAIEARNLRRVVCLTEETSILGGQYSAEAVPPDNFNFTNLSGSWVELQHELMAPYRTRYPSMSQTADINPGNCQRPGNCFAPEVIHAVMLARLSTAGVRVYLGLRRGAVNLAGTSPDHITSIEFTHTHVTPDGAALRIPLATGGVVIDATELGDVLARTEHVVYAVGVDGYGRWDADPLHPREPHAPTSGANPACVQPLTYVAGVRREATDDDANLVEVTNAPYLHGSYAYDAAVYGGTGTCFSTDFDTAGTCSLPDGGSPTTTWARWRQIEDSAVLAGGPQSGGYHPMHVDDVTSVNLLGTANILDRHCPALPWGCRAVTDSDADQDALFDWAKGHTLNYLYWIQVSAQRSNGTHERDLRTDPQTMGTPDGMAAYPYIREGRRILAQYQLAEADTGVVNPYPVSGDCACSAWGSLCDCRPLGARFPDSIGVEQYQTDLKECAAGDPELHGTNPFPFIGAARLQMRLASMIPASYNHVQVDGLIAGNAKNMGVSHLANASYRFHLADWNVGRAAGVVAATAVELVQTPRSFLATATPSNPVADGALRLAQYRLLRNGGGGALAWFSDVGRQDSAWLAVQMMGASGVMGGYNEGTFSNLSGPPTSPPNPDMPLTRAEAAIVAVRELMVTPSYGPQVFYDVPPGATGYGEIQGLAALGAVSGHACGPMSCPCDAQNRACFLPGSTTTRAEFSKIVAIADCNGPLAASLCIATPSANPFADAQAPNWFAGYVSANADTTPPHPPAHPVQHRPSYYANDDVAGPCSPGSLSSCFLPNGALTRRMAAVWLWNHMQNRLRLASPPIRVGDRDHDMRTDRVVYRPSTGEWRTSRSRDGSTEDVVYGGLAHDLPVQGDFDGDGTMDFAVIDTSTWTWSIAESGGGTVTQQWGTSGDVAVPADYDGDGKTDIAVWRPSTQVWWVIRSSIQAPWTHTWGTGAAGEVPLPGDYDGDGLADFATWRPDSGYWTVQYHAGGGFTMQWGEAGDQPIARDYDGDGRVDLGIYRPSERLWFIRNSGGAPDRIVPFGAATDVPLGGDFDGDGMTDIATWSPATATWNVLQSSNGQIVTSTWGAASDVPVVR